MSTVLHDRLNTRGSSVLMIGGSILSGILLSLLSFYFAHQLYHNIDLDDLTLFQRRFCFVLVCIIVGLVEFISWFIFLNGKQWRDRFYWEWIAFGIGFTYIFPALGLLVIIALITM